MTDRNQWALADAAPPANEPEPITTFALNAK